MLIAPAECASVAFHGRNAAKLALLRGTGAGLSLLAAVDARRREGRGFQFEDQADVIPLNRARESAEPGWKVTQKP